MFQLTGISAVGYRSFAQPLEFELRPLTLLYGRNNAGKSAVLRLLPIIADSVADGATSPFDIARVTRDGASFLDTLARGSTQRDLKRLALTLVWSHQDGRRQQDEYQLKYIDEADRTIIAALTIRDPTGHVQFAAEAQPYPDHLSYRNATNNCTSPDVMIDPGFIGLVPSPNSGITALNELRQRMVSLRRNIQWLQSVRTRWDRLVTKTGSAYRLLAPDGSHAAEALLTDGSVFEEVKRWYAGPDIMRQLDASEFSRRWRILLNPPAGELRDIDLLDTGEGMIQVLPVLVACALARKRGNGSILAIEEPESHLHANAQQALAAHLCEIAAAASPPTIIAETHSRVLLLGVQLAIAEGRLPPERCCVYWVDQEVTGESILTKVEFDRHGRFKGGWPQTAFDEDQALARRLLDRQMQGGVFG
jgi:predicted ATPase